MKRSKSVKVPACIAAASAAVFASTLIFMLFYLAPSSPGQARDSVVVVDTTIEAEVSPFVSFFFGIKAGKQIVHARGSGFVVNGHLLTALHVVAADRGEKIVSISVTTIEGKTALVELVRADRATDIAELAPADHGRIWLPSLHLAYTNPALGDKVSMVGHPGMIHWVISYGTIVGFDVAQGYNIATLDTFGGNSGGPVMNARGQVIGMCHTILRGSRFTGIGTLTDMRNFLYPESIR